MKRLFKPTQTQTQTQTHIYFFVFFLFTKWEKVCGASE